MKHTFSYLLFFFLAAIALSSCKKDPKSNTPPSTAGFYFLANVDGEDISIEFLTNNGVELSTSNNASIDPPNCTFSYGAFIGPEEVTDGPIAGIDFNQLFQGDCGSESTVFNDLFPMGDYPFTDANTLGKSIIVRYNDETGFYSSANGPQSNAQFIITNSATANDAFGLGQTVTGTFHCTLYGEFGGMKELTNGTFKMHFRPWF